MPTMLAEAATPTLLVRPGLDVLRRNPTLCEIGESWGKIELKLETEDTRYWLTTEGLPERSRQAPANYVVNFVTIEKRTREGRWDLSAVFSPEAWKLSQAFDYCQLLYREMRVLNERLEAQSTNLYAESLEMIERYVITRVLRITKGNQSKAAKMLGITRGSLRNKIHALGISIDQVVHIENSVPEKVSAKAE